MSTPPANPLEGPVDLDPEEPAAGRPITLFAVSVVFAGGFAGALARYLVERAIPAGATGFPLATWMINTSGAFLIGVIATFLSARPSVAAWWRLLLVTGVLGAWTTMSAVAAETDGLVHGGRGPALLALGYLAATAIAGVAGCTAGVVLGRALARTGVPLGPGPETD